jgi:RNA polymerase sigma-70 factor (sigma-E family)
VTVLRITRSAEPDPRVEEWVDAALPRLMGPALSLTGHRHDAEDLVQETLAKVILKWDNVERADSPDAYVRRAMVNTFISGKRRRSSTELVSHEAVTDERRISGRAGHDTELAARDHMWQLLATLPPRQRAVLVLRYYDDLPDAQIAEVLGCSGCRCGSPPPGPWGRGGERSPRRRTTCWPRSSLSAPEAACQGRVARPRGIPASLRESGPCPAPTADAATTLR